MDQFDFYRNTPCNTTMSCSLPDHDEETILGYCLKCETAFCVNCLIKVKNHQSHLEDCLTLKKIVRDFSKGRYDIQIDREQLVKQFIEDQEETKKIQTTFISNPQAGIERLEKILHREEWMIQQMQIHKEHIENCFKQFNSQICYDQKYITKTIKQLYKFFNNREKFFKQIQELIIRTKEKVYKKIDQQEIIKKYTNIQKKLKSRVEYITNDLFCCIKKLLNSKYLQEQQNADLQQYWLKSFFEQDFPQIFYLQQRQTQEIIKFLIEQMIQNKNISSFVILGLKLMHYYTDSICDEINQNYYRALILFYKQFKSFFDFQDNYDLLQFQKQKINNFVEATLKKLDNPQYPFQISQQQNLLVFYDFNNIQNNLNSPQIKFSLSLIQKVPRVKFIYETKYLKIFVDQLINKYSCNIQMLLLKMEIDSKLFSFILDIFHIKLLNNQLLPQISKTYIENKVKTFDMAEFYQQIEIAEPNFNYNNQENLYYDKDQFNFKKGNNEVVIKQHVYNEFFQQFLLHRNSYLLGMS